MMHYRLQKLEKNFVKILLRFLLDRLYKKLILKSPFRVKSVLETFKYQKNGSYLSRFLSLSFQIF